MISDAEFEPFNNAYFPHSAQSEAFVRNNSLFNMNWRENSFRLLFFFLKGYFRSKCKTNIYGINSG